MSRSTIIAVQCEQEGVEHTPKGALVLSTNVKEVFLPICTVRVADLEPLIELTTRELGGLNEYCCLQALYTGNIALCSGWYGCWIITVFAAAPIQLMDVDIGNATVEPWRPRPSGLENCCRSTRKEQRLLGSLGHILRCLRQPRTALQRQFKVWVQS